MTNDPAITKTPEYQLTVLGIEMYDKMVKHACFIIGAHRVEPEFVRLEIAKSGHIRVSWPEVYDSYGDCSIRTETALIEPTMFLKSEAEIQAIWDAEQQELMREQAAKARASLALRIKTDENRERAEYERLKAKYGDER